MKYNSILILWIILSWGFSSNLVGQSLPELCLPEFSKVYSGMFNDIKIKINDADPNLIKIKASDTHIKKVNDTLYQIMLRGLTEGEEIKVKLYYKNLPVDLTKMTVFPSPIVNVTVNGVQKSIKLTIEEAMNAEINAEMEDEVLRDYGYELYAFDVMLVSGENKMLPLFNARNGKLDILNRYANRFQKGDKLVFNNVKLKNASNNLINCQSNYIEIIID